MCRGMLRSAELPCKAACCLPLPGCAQVIGWMRPAVIKHLLQLGYVVYLTGGWVEGGSAMGSRWRLHPSS